MEKSDDLDDIRRRAPLHFWAKADNARYCAWCLWNLITSEGPQDPNVIGYRGDTDIALSEGWQRERSLALECIIKAAFARRERGMPVPATHDVSRLWDAAKLPKVGKDDRIRLVLTAQVLQWSGRYAAPIEGSDGQRSPLAQLTRRRGSVFTHQPKFGWGEFDSLYQRAVSAI